MITNAPMPGTPYSAGPRPNPKAGDIYQYSSDGVFRQNQLIANFNIRAGAKLSLFGYYSLNYANSDPLVLSRSVCNNFPSDQYNLRLDYGRASFAIRDRVFMGGTIGLPRGFRLSPFMIFNSGAPYNVTVGQDLSNDLQFNDRPAFAHQSFGFVPVSDGRGLPIRGSDALRTLQIPINYLTGPSQFTLNLRLAKTFGFGPEVGGKSGAQPGGGPGGGGPRGGGGGGGGGGLGRPGGGGGPFSMGPATNRRYNLTFSVNARNVLNRVNAAPPIGVLSSPRFRTVDCSGRWAVLKPGGQSQN